MKILGLLMALIPLMGCTSTGEKMKVVDQVEISRFMGPWYVLAGRFTFLEKDVHNGLEVYTWNDKESRIDVGFTYRQGSFTGPEKSLPQKAWIHDASTNAHWKVSPLWPFKFDYLVVALDPNYEWTAIGVPNQKYLWIMARDWKNPEPVIEAAKKELERIGYRINDLVLVPHQWP